LRVLLKMMNHGLFRVYPFDITKEAFNYTILSFHVYEESVADEATNRNIAHALNFMGQLLEITGEESFKVRAYYQASATIERTTRRIKEMRYEDLLLLPHIGKNIAKKIIEYTETGHIREMDELMARIPSGLVELLKLEGVGPKTVNRLWIKLGIENVEDLETAARRHRIRAIKGFGEKREQDILSSISHYQQRSNRITLIEAEQIIDRVASVMIEGSYTVAGSYRRGKSTIGDIDFVTNELPGELNPKLREVADDLIDVGDRKTSIRVSGVRVDIRYSKPEIFGSMLMYLTGSKAFNIHMRAVALSRGLKINEYGIEDRESGEKCTFRDEKSMFSFLSMPYIPPELREDTGEIELAFTNNLPELVKIDEIRGDLHVHSTWSDGHLTLEELLKTGEELGYEYMLCSDHSATLGVAGGLTGEDIRRQNEQIAALNKESDCHLLAGIEVDILADGTLGLPDRVLSGLDMVIASIHSGFRQERDILTRRVISAIQNEHVDIIGHPTGRILGRREPYAIDMERVIETAAEHGTALEINASPYRLDLDDVNVRQAIEHGVKISIGTDAHRMEEFSAMRFGVSIARRGWCRSKDILNTLHLDDLMERPS
jgi:DNA polymerase (family 10)